MKKSSAIAGNTFITTLVVITLLVGFIAGAIVYTQQLGRLSKRTRDAQIAMEIGDGCLENLFTHWRNMYRVLATASPYVLPTNYFYTDIYHPGISPAGTPLIPIPKDSVNGSTLNLFPDVPPNFTILQYRIQAVDPMITLKTVGTDTERSTIADIAIAPGAYGPNLIQYSYYYLAAVDVQYPGLDGKSVTTKVRRVFEKQFSQPWTWAIAYNDDLEISPSSALTINGKIQTNGNLYTGTSALSLTDKTSYVGSWNIGWAPGDTYHTGTPVSPNYPSNLPPAQGPNFLPFGWDARQMWNTTDDNPNNDGYHEIIDRPTSGYSDPLTPDTSNPSAGQRLYNEADIRVLIDGSGAVTIMNGSGAVVSNSSSSTNDKNIYTTMKGALSTGQTFQDNREAATMRVADVDVSKITAAINNKSFTATNSSYGWVVYISDTSSTSTTKRGIRLINGQTLPPAGITFVSDNPVYIKGDFNTGGNPPSNNSGSPDPTKPTVSGYTKAPAAIFADAITLLSGAWNDSNSSNSLSTRVASNTTVNAALIGGIVPSSGGNYSGGAENFVRFLENWTNKNFTYYGSMVQLYNSGIGIGTWGKANVYNAPTQKWYYESMFQKTWPPGNIIFAGYLQQQRWYQVY
jgi:hypothetical protein